MDDPALDDRARGNARRAGAAGIHAAGVAVSCPVCGKPAEAAYRPFCSRRCADVDLGRWFNEDYRIPAPEADDGPDDDTETGADESVGRGGAGAGNPRGGLAHRDAGGGAAGGLARTSNL